ncbi:hypothetical protein Taro_009972 [Colocasia esculenta]|uniref:Indole-3-acetate O-methyltransferase 1 n=1 Tax=Colocasia esculenta TaxID=4460 RepID=A0A843U6G0_COLES|nr:hypothetical protein [Colocasia esculenta]
MATTLQGESLAVAPVKLEGLLSMKGGNGEASYVKNSQAQARHARSILHLLEATLDAVPLPEGDEHAFTVADLGCSCGNNTLFMVDVIVRHIAKRYELSGREAPEFQAFFSDLPSNDFNLLFQLLPPLTSFEGGSLGQCLAAAGGSRPYYAAGVPGSFYRHLFPERSVDFFYSAFSLH